MARGRKDDAPVGLVVVGGIIWAASQAIEALSGVPVDFWITAVVIVFGLCVFWVARTAIRNRAYRLASKSAAQKAADATEEHLASLVRRRAQLVRPDAYGKPRFEGWQKEITYFVDEHIKPRLTPLEYRAFVQEDQPTIEAAIGARVELEAEKNPAFLAFSDEMTPSEFEVFCAEELRRGGWDARVTLQSRDQGVDVVAQKGGIRIVLQCKLYSRPVGNKAVQEAAAGRAHERASFGAVVSNNRYTQDAERLAVTNNILLLHYSDLQKIDSLVRPTTPVIDAWYYADHNGHVGPLGIDELRQTLATLPNPSNVLVWCDRFSDWKRVAEVRELRMNF